MKFLALFRRQPSKELASITRFDQLPAPIQDQVRALVKQQVALHMDRFREYLDEAAESAFDRTQQSQTMHVSALSSRIDRLEGVKTFPDRVIRGSRAVPDAAEIAGRAELEAAERSGHARVNLAGGTASVFQAPDMDRRDAPVPSDLHPDASMLERADGRT